MKFNPVIYSSTQSDSGVEISIEQTSKGFDVVVTNQSDDELVRASCLNAQVAEMLMAILDNGMINTELENWQSFSCHILKDYTEEQ